MSSTPSVYSYTRFSTPEQAAGDSRRRQSDAAVQWTDRKNAERVAGGLPALKLDERLRLSDLGVSAFRGANVEEDRGLGGFLFACREGLIPAGSYFLVESLDRISRMTPRRVTSLINDIVDAGVTIVTLSDGQEFNQERLDNDPMALLISLLVAWRGHEESRMKGLRVAEAWAEKRRQVRAGEAQLLTRRAPVWLDWDGHRWVPNPVHVDTIRRAFRMTTDGMGAHAIARQFNMQGTPLMGRGERWHRSTVAKLLQNRAVIGDLVPGRMKFDGGRRVRELLEPIPKAFPAVISLAEWDEVQTLKSGAPGARGRGAAAPVANLLGGLARCPECGAAMTRVFKGAGRKAGRPKLVCTAAKTGAAGHRYRAVNLHEVEAAIVEKWQELVIDIPAGTGGGDLDADHQAIRNDIDGTEALVDDLREQHRKRPSPALGARVAALEASLPVLKAAAASLDRDRGEVGHGVAVARAKRLVGAMEIAADKSQMNAALRLLFDGVLVDYERGRLVFNWRQGGRTELIYRWPENGPSSGWTSASAR